MTDTKRAQDRPPEYWGLFIILFSMIVSGLGTWFGIIVVQYLGLSFEKNLLASMRLMLSLMLLIMVLPLSIVIEVMWSRWKRRVFHTSGVLASILLLLEVVLILFMAATIFDFLFPGLHFTTEPFAGLTGLVLGLLVGLPMVAVALTIRIPKVHTYMKRAFETEDESASHE